MDEDFVRSPLKSFMTSVFTQFRTSLVVKTVKNLPTMQKTGFFLWVGKIPCRRKWLSTPVFFLRKFHGQRRLVGYNPRGCKELDKTEQLTLSLSQSEHNFPESSHPSDPQPREAPLPGNNFSAFFFFFSRVFFGNRSKAHGNVSPLRTRREIL